MNHKIICGDCLEKIKKIPDSSIHLTCTCYDDKTKVLTKEGFKLFNELSPGDYVATINKNTGELEYEIIKDIQKYKYSGIIFDINGESIDLSVTPNHNMYVSIPGKTKYTLIQIKDFVKRKQWSFKKSCIWRGIKKNEFILPKYSYFTLNKNGTKKLCVKKQRTLNMNTWLTFLGYYISESSTYKSKHGNLIILYQNTGPILDKMEECIKKLGFNYTRMVRRVNSGQIRISDIQLMSYLQRLGKTKEKHIPGELLNLPPEQLVFLFLSLMEGDGSKNGKLYITTSRILKEQFQELLLKLGLNGSVKEKNIRDVYIRDRLIKKEHCSPCYIISINRHKLNPIYHNKKTTSRTYNGFVYCCTTINGTLLVQRNGKSVWCGNSPPYFRAKEYNKEYTNIGNNIVYQDYIFKLNLLIKELFRITVPGGRICFNTSPVIDTGIRYAIPFDVHTLFLNNGFVFEEDIIWRKPDGAARLRCGGWVQNGQRPTTWHANIVTEYINIYRKPGERETGKFRENALTKYRPNILTNVWDINPINIDWHDAPYPPELAERLILLYSYEGDTIFDPFSGTLTNLQVARNHNRNSISIELSKEYLEKAKNRVGFGQKTLFNETVYEEE